jgi:hypothetical protein
MKEKIQISNYSPENKWMTSDDNDNIKMQYLGVTDENYILYPTFETIVDGIRYNCLVYHKQYKKALINSSNYEFGMNFYLHIEKLVEKSNLFFGKKTVIEWEKDIFIGQKTYRNEKIEGRKNKVYITPIEDFKEVTQHIKDAIWYIEIDFIKIKIDECIEAYHTDLIIKPYEIIEKPKKQNFIHKTFI